MYIIPFCNLLLGSFNGIATYKQNPIDNMLLVSYFSIITPYQLVSAYSSLDILARIRLQAISAFIHIPVSATILTVGNLSVFALGHIFGKIAYSTYSIPLN